MERLLENPSTRSNFIVVEIPRLSTLALTKKSEETNLAKNHIMTGFVREFVRDYMDELSQPDNLHSSVTEKLNLEADEVRGKLKEADPVWSTENMTFREALYLPIQLNQSVDHIAQLEQTDPQLLIQNIITSSLHTSLISVQD